MRVMLILMAVSLLAAGPVFAAKTSEKAARSRLLPHAIGHYEDWTAAVHQEAGTPVCYAFTRASGSTPQVTGRGDVVLTVTQRPSRRDAVAISAGFAYGAHAGVVVSPDGAPPLEFYTAQRSAFARDGRAAVTAFQRARQVVARSPGPRGTVVSDTFSLRGFSAAYAAIQRACPVGNS